MAIGAALVCAGLDLGLKGGLENGLHHERPVGLIVLSWALAVALVVLVPHLPSHPAALAAGIGAGGAIGNAVSAMAWSGGVPDPLVLSLGEEAVAFNLADVFALSGAALLLAAAAAYVLRHPGSLRRPL